MVEQLLSMPEALGSILSTDKHTNKQATDKHGWYPRCGGLHLWPQHLEGWRRKTAEILRLSWDIQWILSQLRKQCETVLKFPPPEKNSKRKICSRNSLSLHIFSLQQLFEADITESPISQMERLRHVLIKVHVYGHNSGKMLESNAGYQTGSFQVL